jgi:hypothetical protein
MTFGKMFLKISFGQMTFGSKSVFKMSPGEMSVGIMLFPKVNLPNCFGTESAELYL